MSKSKKNKAQSKSDNAPKTKKKLSKKGKRKLGLMADRLSSISLDASSSVSSSALSAKSGSAPGSSGQSSGSAKKLQCDLCKLSYSSDKELTEHLVSLMHHTKLEGKELNRAHECVLCKVDCKNMIEYRKHTALPSHLQKIAILKGEHVPQQPKKSRWGPKAKNWQGNLNKNFGNNQPQSWYKSGKQGGNLGSWAFSQPPSSVNSWSQQSQSQPNRFPNNAGVYGSSGYNSRPAMSGYNSGPPRGSAQNQGQWFYDDLPLNSPANGWTADAYPTSKWPPQRHGYHEVGGQRYEPWGSGMYGDWQERQGYSSYGNNSGREFQREDNQHGHWDEQSLLMQEQFLASMEDNSEGGYRAEERSMNGQGNDNTSWNVNRQNNRQWGYNPQQWGSGAKPALKDLENSSSSEFSRGKESHETETAAAAVDRKRPVPDGGHEDVQGSVAPKSSRPRILSPDAASKTKTVVSGTAVSSVASEVLPSVKLPPPPHKAGTSDLDNTSDDLLQRAERLCKELREKRLASTHAYGSKSGAKHQETILNQRLDDISQQRRQKYIKGIIGDGTQDSLSGDKSGDSGVSVTASSQRTAQKIREAHSTDESRKASPSKHALGQQKSLTEIRKSLEVSLPDKNVQKANRESGITGSPRTRRDSTPAATASKQGTTAPPRERRDSSSSAGSKQPLKAAVSLKKMINAPRSRDERLHLAKLLLSRDDTTHHKATAASGSSRPPLQLEGLYDSQLPESPDLPEAVTPLASSSAETDGAVSTIKLEDLGVDLRKQILSLIGSDCPGLEEIQLSVPGSQKKSVAGKTSTEETIVLSDSGQSSKGQKKKGNNNKEVVAKKKTDVNNKNLKNKKAKKSVSSLNDVSAKGDKPLENNDDLDVEIIGNVERTNSGGKTKTKLSSPDVVMVDLRDSEDEFEKASKLKEIQSPAALKKKKKKKKIAEKERQGQEVSSSQESDDLSQRFRSPKTVFSPGLSQGSRRSNVDIAQVSSPRSDSEKQRQSLLQSKSDKQVELSKLKSPGIPGYKAAVANSKKSATEEDEPSLNRQNVYEKFPMLMESLHMASSSPHKSLVATTTSTTTPTSDRPSSSTVSVNSSYISPVVTSRSYARASTMSSSPSPSTLTSMSQSGTTVGSNPAETTVPTSTLNLQLPPSIHLASSRTSESAATRAMLSVGEAGTSLHDNCESVTRATTKADPEDDQHHDEDEVGRSVVVEDISDFPAAAAGHKSGEDEGLSQDSLSVFSNETSSQAMSELLQLSEREEQIKQEAMSMELRLTRLHRLLEQAVVQINKCTERRSQLQEEEKEISSKRLALLRDAAKGRASSLSSSQTSAAATTPAGSVTVNNGGNSLETAIDSATLGRLATGSALPLSASRSMQTSVTTSIPTSSESATTSTLSRADWLAKFASFLPPDPTLERERQATTALPFERLNSATEVSRPEEAGRTHEEGSNVLGGRISPVRRNLSMPVARASSKESNLDSTGSYYSVIEYPSSNSAGTTATLTTTTTTATSSTKFTTPDDSSASKSSSAIINLPCMYLGSFLKPSVPTAVVSHHSEEGVHQSSAHPPFGRLDRGRQNSTDILAGGVVALPEPASASRGLYAAAGEDSDIGSVASSLASGASSLGEHIVQHCRTTPGASVDPSPAADAGLGGGGGASRQQSRDLSVILSSDASLSDHHSSNNLRGEEEEGHYIGRRGQEEGGEEGGLDDVLRPCSVSLQRLEGSRKGLYGSLDTEAVRSAEALHLMERNYEDPRGKVQDGGAARETTSSPALSAARPPSRTVSEGGGGLVANGEGGRWAHSPNIGLSDDSEHVGKRKKKRLTRQEREASQLTRHRQRWMVSSSSSSEGEQEEGKTGLGGSLRGHQPSPAREGTAQNSCTVEKLGTKDQDGNPVVMSELKQEIQGDVIVAECDSSTNLGIVDSESIRQRTKTLREMRESFERTFGRSPRPSKPLSAEDTEPGVDDRDWSRDINSTTHDSAAAVVEVASGTKSRHLASNHGPPVPSAMEERRETGLRRYEGSQGVVCEMQVVNGHLYVGYQCVGISVFDLAGSTEEKISEHAFTNLECFYVTEIDQTLTVIVGNGSFLVFCSASEEETSPQDMGTPIRCIQYSAPEVFLGLDTGEICVVNTKTKEKRSRFICSDQPVRSMALAQEGAMKLLCVSALDGSISVVNIRQCLLLRILFGHTKTAFSLQVDKSSVFSGSMDGTVLEQNLHTTSVEHTYRDHRGVVMAVHLYKDFIFTAGIDKLVRCYNHKTHKLVQVNYGAGRGVISKIVVQDNKLITGNLNGTVDAIDFNLDAQNKCPLPQCGLNFGHGSHLQWHMLEEQHFVDTEQTPVLVE